MSTTSALPNHILDAAHVGNGRLKDAIRRAGGAPLQQGETTTFLYVGEAEVVRLKHWMDIFPVLPPFSRLPGTNLWSLDANLPPRSRIEYKISLNDEGKRRVILDPLNPLRARDPFGTNSVVTGPLYVRPDWSLPHPDVQRGTTQTVDIDSEIFGDRRVARLYTPAAPSSGRLPLLVAHDGSEYAEFGALTVVLDNLIARGEISPLACVLTDPLDRMAEYGGDARHADHLVEELIPAMSAQVNLDTSRTILLGASLGGVASLHAADRHPGRFAGMILQSGSFVTALGGRHRRGSAFAPVVEFMKSWSPTAHPMPRRIHVSCGRFDGLIDENRAIARRLTAAGLDVSFEEVPDGHNWENWRDRLRAGLLHTAR